MKQITPDMLSALTRDAEVSPRRRAHLNFHPQLDDPVQRLAVAMEPDTVVFPHRHPQTWELLVPLRGRFVVLHFDEAGKVTRRVLLQGEGSPAGADEARVVENPAGGWHAVLSLDPGAVILEVKTGPYRPLGPADIAPWAPGADDPALPALLAWFAVAREGEVWR